VLDPQKDYPLSQKHPEWVSTPSGIPLNEVSLDRVVSGEIDAGDLRITPETLRRQADIAEAAGQRALAGNLRRAAELTGVPNEKILAVYNALRPHRATRQEVEALCTELEQVYHASETAAFIRSALPLYEEKHLFKRLKQEDK